MKNIYEEKNNLFKQNIDREKIERDNSLKIEKAERLSDALTKTYKTICGLKESFLNEDFISEKSLEENYMINNLIKESFSELKIQKEKRERKLLEYVGSGDLEKVEKLLNSGADPNYCEIKTIEGRKNKIKYTALKIAVCKGDLRMAQMLIDKGADVNRILEKKRNYLYFAAFHDDFKMIILLLQNNINRLHLDYKKKNFIEYLQNISSSKHIGRNHKNCSRNNQVEEVNSLDAIINEHFFLSSFSMEKSRDNYLSI